MSSLTCSQPLTLPTTTPSRPLTITLAFGVNVKMVAGGHLPIAKETGRRLGPVDHMYPAKVPKEGPKPGSKYQNLDEIILDADGFAGVFPEHKYESPGSRPSLRHD